MKVQNLIWLFCVLILIQVAWIWLRLEKLKQKNQEALRAQQERQLEQEEAIKEELLDVPEPEIEEKLSSGGRLWLVPEKGVFSTEFTLEVWAESRKPLSKIDVRLFYPSQLLELAGDGWQKEREGAAFWSKELSSDNDREDPLVSETAGEEEKEGRFLVSKITFKIKNNYSNEVKEAALDFDFSKESRMDCNLYDRQGNDVLEEVFGARLNLKF